MALEASELAVRVKLLGGSAFRAEADSTAGSLDKIGAAGKRSGANVVSGGNKSHNMMTKMGAKASKVGSQMIGFGRTMSMVGIPVAALGYYAAKSSAQFSQAMTLLSTQANMPYKSIKAVSTAVEQMAPKVGATPLALAQALYPIESIGLRGKAAMNALKAASMGTAVGLDSLENTADAVTTVMASKIKGAGGPVQAMSIMDRAIGLGKMHLQDLTESFKSGIVPISKQFGLSFKQILAAASGLTRVGIPANQVMARMRLTLTSMIAPTTAGLKAMSAMGITQFQLADDLRKPGGLVTALKDIKTHAEALGNKDLANQYIAQMFGKSRGMASIGSLLEQLPQIQGIYNKVMGTTPKTLETHFAQTEQTSAFKYKQIQANYYGAMIKLGDALNRVLLPLLVKLVPILTGVVNWFGRLSPGVQKFLVILLGASVVGGPILMFVGALTKIGGAILGWMGVIGTATTETTALAGAEGIGGVMGAFSALIPVVLAAGAAFFLLTHKKQVHKAGAAIYHAGHEFGQNVIGGGYAAVASLFGDKRGENFLNWQHLYHSNEWRHLRPDQRSAIFFRLQHPHAKLTGRNALLAGFSQIGGGDVLQGVKLPNLPGLDRMEPGMRTQVPRVKGSSPFQGPDIIGAIKEHANGIDAKFQITSNTYLNGKHIATAVNEFNRKSQNRR